MAKAEAITARWGPLMVVAARFVVVLRQLNGLVAGTTGMSWPRFFAANLVGAALWVGLWTTLAWRFGHDARIVPFIWHHLSLVADGAGAAPDPRARGAAPAPPPRLTRRPSRRRALTLPANALDACMHCAWIVHTLYV